jgi:hypothetical protein
MSRSMILAATLICCIGTASAQDSVTWARVEGIITPGSPVGTGTGTVPGGMLPWTTTRGSVYVNLTNGQVQFVVQGLVLAGRQQHRHKSRHHSGARHIGVRHERQCRRELRAGRDRFCGAERNGQRIFQRLCDIAFRLRQSTGPGLLDPSGSSEWK